ncbi:hypothetical protein HYY75_07285 [bacterium]|nr:hypothetical protein [bacterium]
MKNRILLAGIFLLGFLLPFNKAFLSNQSKDFFRGQEAPIFPLKGRYAEKKLSSYLTPFPVDFSLWLMRGRKYLFRKEFEQAVWAFRKALNENPLSGEAHFLLGFSYEARGLEGLPGDSTAWDELAEIEYRAAINVSDELPARFNLGMLLNRLDRKSEARKEFEYILLVSPNSLFGKRAKIALDRNVSSHFLPQIVSNNSRLEESGNK